MQLVYGSWLRPKRADLPLPDGDGSKAPTPSTCPAIRTGSPATALADTWTGCGITHTERDIRPSSCSVIPWVVRSHWTTRCGFPEDLAGLVLIGTGARLRVHPDYLNRCLDDAQWRSEAPGYYEAINRELAPQLAARALQSGPMVEHNDLACLRQVRRDGAGQGDRVCRPWLLWARTTS